MKKIYISLLALTFLLGSSHVIAQTPTVTDKAATKSATLDVIDKSIQNLKDKIATKVAELRKEQERLITSHIDKIAKDAITIETEDNKKYSISIDDTITKYYSVASGKKELELKDLEVGDYLIFKGTIIDNTITANSIFRDEEYSVGSGKITDIDTAAGTIDVSTIDKTDLTFDIVKTTKLEMIDVKTFDVSVTTLAKMKEGDSIHYVAHKLAPKATSSEATRLLVLPQEYFIIPSPTK